MKFVENFEAAPMNTEELAIRDLIARWHSATAAGDVDTILGLMADDAVFLVAGQPPMEGRSAFERALRQVLAGHRIESTGNVLEVEVCGSLAYAWTHLTVRVVPLTGRDAMVRTGSALSVLRKQPDGPWVLTRDANLLARAS
ncbi:MAG TPA: SgcJ/EcaC family oxidoreductase [Vicinamibacterales bacterium]|nr:SgcJ/EcaC family oxidoreductase [Vicinamibacterales bacterium]